MAARAAATGVVEGAHRQADTVALRAGTVARVAATAAVVIGVVAMGVVAVGAAREPARRVVPMGGVLGRKVVQ